MPITKWKCPKCKTANEDTRLHFVMCVGCGKTFDDITEKMRNEITDDGSNISGVR